MELRKVFAQNLRLLRKDAGFSQEDLADKAKLDRTYVSALERCLYSASLDTIERLAKALKVPAVAFLRPPEASAAAKVRARKARAR